MNKHLAILSILLLTFFSSFAEANENTAKTFFEQGNSYYSEGKYHKALSAYQSADSLGVVSPELYYNLGNTYYKLGDYPLAIYYYKKVLKYNPGDKAAKQNLELARSKTIDKFEIIPQSPFTKMWHSIILLTTAKSWTYIALLFVFLAFAAFVLYRFGNSVSVKRMYFVLGLSLLTLSLLSAFFGYENQQYFTQNKEAVVVAPTIDIYSEPANKGAKLFTIHEGVEVIVEDELNGYVKIKLPNDKTGWIDKKYLMIV